MADASSDGEGSSVTRRDTGSSSTRFRDERFERRRGTWELMTRVGAAAGESVRSNSRRCVELLGEKLLSTVLSFFFFFFLFSSKRVTRERNPRGGEATDRGVPANESC